MKFMRAIVPLLFVAICLLLPARAYADAPIQLYLNQIKLEPEVPPQIVNGGTTIVPVRIVSEQLGAKVSWFETSRVVKVEQGTTTIEMKIDDPVVTVNGKSEKLEAAPKISDGSTLVPIRFIAEQLGLKVGWDQLTRSVMLFKQAEEPASAPTKPEPVVTPPAETKDKDTETKGTDTKETSSAVGGVIKAVVSGTKSESSEPSGNGSTGSTGGTSSSSGSSGTGSTSPDKTSTAKPEAGSSNAVLSKLEVVGGEIVIQTSGFVTPTAFALSDPYRIVIDLPNTELGAFGRFASPGQISDMAVIHPLVSKIRYALNSNSPAVVRIVLDMKQASDYQLKEVVPGKMWAISFVSKKYKVVIDPGHGGKDPGAESINSRVEKEFTLSLSNKVHMLLQQQPAVRSIMTRTDDSYPTLQDRVDLANNQNADLFISIHGNSYKSTISGTETYYSRQDSFEFASRLHGKIIEAAGLPDRNVRQSHFKVVRDTTMPAALLEIGYLTHAQDASLMYNDDFQNRVAEAIVSAILEQLQIR